jgi:GTP-binding protein
VPTGVLNNLFVRGLEEKWSASHPANKLDIRYITQVSVDPPCFVVFTTGKKMLHFSTERFLVNQLRENFGFYASPLRIEQRMKGKHKWHPGSHGD